MQSNLTSTGLQTSSLHSTRPTTNKACFRENYKTPETSHKSHLQQYRRAPPTPNSDDVIYEQPLNCRILRRNIAGETFQDDVLYVQHCV